MARIRTVKPEFFLHEGLFDLEQETGLPIRLAFAGLWCHADREGRFTWRPRTLGAQILPFDDIDFSRVLDALVTRGFLVRYACGRDVYGCIPTFTKHQIVNPRERKSVIPPFDPVLDSSTINDLAPTSSTRDDASVTREARDDRLCALEGKGREGNGKGKEHTCSPNGRTRKRRYTDPPGFDDWYKRYPRKVARQNAADAFETALNAFVVTKRVTDRAEALAQLIEVTDVFAMSDVGKSGRFCPHPASWLNAQRFFDDQTTWSQKHGDKFQHGPGQIYDPTASDKNSPGFGKL